METGRDRPLLIVPSLESPGEPPRALRAPRAVGAAPGAVVEQKLENVFSDPWILLALAFLVGGFLANRHPGFIALGTGILLIIMVGRWWRNNALHRVSYERTFDRTHVFPGEPIIMTVTVQNDKQLPLTWLQFYDRTPLPPDSGTRLNRIMAELISETTRRFTLRNAYALQSHERLERNFSFTINRRGYYRLGPVRYQSGDPFTLFLIDRIHDYRETLVVYPQLWPLTELALPARELFGELSTRRSLFTDPVRTQGARDYQPQDRFRDVHWKATARRGSLQSKVYEPTTGMSIILFLNVATFAEYWRGQNPELLERAVSVAASLANYSTQERWTTGLYANGTVPGSDQPIRVRPSRSPAQLVKILEALAAVTEFPTGPLETLMLRESPRLPWAASFVVITAVVTDELLTGLVNLRRSGRRITLISLADEAPPDDLRDILTFHIPPTLPAFQKGVTGRTATEAALRTIVTTEPVNLTLERVEHGDHQPAA